MNNNPLRREVNSKAPARNTANTVVSPGHKNIVFAAINAKFIHSCYALHLLKAVCSDSHPDIGLVEYTINHRTQDITEDVVFRRPCILCFSCYIWNITIIRRIAADIRKIMPDCIIILGGPEVSYDSPGYLDIADFIVIGEGETSLKQLLDTLCEGKTDFSGIAGLCYRSDEVIFTGESMPSDMSKLPFAYDDMSQFNNRIVYYETQRGCPFRCAYCLSGSQSALRLAPFEKIKDELDFFLKSKLPQLKFVDRTFNADKNHAASILRYLIDNDNGITNFHFEISAELLDDETITLLKTARSGLFQFEIGVQSSNEKTLASISRKSNPCILKEKASALCTLPNIHVHLDLIAGLPYEDLSSFQKSFDFVYSMHPEQLQLGFLKLLKGSSLDIKAKQLGIICSDEAPYEVLKTPWLSFEDIAVLKRVEEMTESLYNSGKFVFLLKYLDLMYDSMFDFFRRMSEYFFGRNSRFASHKKLELYASLFDFCRLENQDMRIVGELIKYDLLLNENLPVLPDYLTSGRDIRLSKRIFADSALREKYLQNVNERDIKFKVRIEPFKFDITDISLYMHPVFETSYVLFDYTQAMEGATLRTFHARNINITNEIRQIL